MSVSPQLIQFKESPYSPWGSEIASRSRNGSRPLSTPGYSASVGRISTVNALIGEKGLECRVRLPCLVVDQQRNRVKAPGGVSEAASSSDESESELEMDRRLRRSRGVKGRRRSRQTQKPPGLPMAAHSSAKVHSAAREEEEVKVQTARDDSGSESEDDDKEQGKQPADTVLIELASFPGYDPDHPTPLPHGLVPLDQMKRVTRAQTKLASKREGFRETWKQLFYSPASLAIYQDYFWWYFLHRYQAGQHPVVQDLLFARISNNYVRLLCDPIEERWREAFFKMYPDAVAQCVYSTFIHAYPTSWNSFDEEFKIGLCQFISLWQVGTKPLPNSWERWELSLLEPPNLLKHVGKDEQKSPRRDSKSPRRGTFNLDSLIKEAQKRESVASEKSDQTRPQEHVSLVAAAAHCFGTQDEDTDEDKRILLSDIEKALVSPSVSRHQLSPRSSTTSSKPLQSADVSKKIKKEKAREQLSGLKKLLTDKTSSHPVLSQTFIAQEDKKHSQCKQTSSSSNRLSTAEKEGRSPKPSPKKSGTCSSKQKSCPDRSQRSSTCHLSGKKGSSSRADKETGGKNGGADKKEEGKKTWKEKALELCAKRKEEEQTPLDGPVFEHSVFDVCGHSPLVKFYLKNKNLKHKKEHSTLVKRTEISELPPAEAVCYKDILDQSKQAEKKNQQMFKRHYRHQKQSMARFQRSRKAEAVTHELDVHKVLSNRKETQELSNELTLHVLAEKCPNRTAVSRAVNDTLDRLGHPKKTG